MKYLRKCIIIITMIILMGCLTGCENKKDNNTSNNSTTNSKSNTSNSSNKNSDNNGDEDNSDVDVESLDFIKLAEKQVAMPEKGETVAIIHIKDFGDVKVKFFKEVAPKAVENFVTHAKEGYYNGLTFHRIINDFMIQGGDPTGTGAGGESIWGKYFEDEFSYDLVPYRGALCMANAGSNTNGSQFFIEQAKYDENTAETLKQYGYPENLLNAYKIHGGSMHLFLRHTVFGQVYEGMDVVDKVAATETNENNGKPIKDVVIESIEVMEY